MRSQPLNILEAKWPLYALRDYKFIQDFDGFKVISSMYRDYILDCPALEGDFVQRRMTLLSMEEDLEFKIYPLKERFTTLGQLAVSKRKVFIDAEGKLVRYRPRKFYEVKYAKVLRSDRTYNGYYRLMTKLPVPFVTDREAEYVGYIQIGAGYYLYCTSEERKAPHKKKI